MRTVLVNAMQQMFWAIYIFSAGIATPDRMRRAGLI